MTTTRRGSTLVEVIVAVVIFQVGFTGVVGMLFLAANTMNRAQALEDAAVLTVGVLDSLAQGWSAGTEDRIVHLGQMSISVDSEGLVRIVVVESRGDTVGDLATLLPVVR